MDGTKEITPYIGGGGWKVERGYLVVAGALGVEPRITPRRASCEFVQCLTHCATVCYNAVWRRVKEHTLRPCSLILLVEPDRQRGLVQCQSEPASRRRINVNAPGLTLKLHARFHVSRLASLAHLGYEVCNRRR